MNIQGMIPTMAAPLQAQATNTSATSGTGSSGSTNDPTSASSLEGTFLSLLVTELQNQDPTQPVDPTEMVSEMISLNQLDQLISINQTLSGMTGGSSGTTSGTAASSSTSGSQSGSPNPILGNPSPILTPPSKLTTTSATHRVNGSLLQQAQTATPAAMNPLQPAYPGAAAAAALNPAAWMNLYGTLGAPANAINKFTTAGGR
jgi:hypothetical protein